jgi:hypothetical protein
MAYRKNDLVKRRANLTAMISRSKRASAMEPRVSSASDASTRSLGDFPVSEPRSFVEWQAYDANRRGSRTDGIRRAPYCRHSIASLVSCKTRLFDVHAAAGCGESLLWLVSAEQAKFVFFFEFVALFSTFSLGDVRSVVAPSEV